MRDPDDLPVSNWTFGEVVWAFVALGVVVGMLAGLHW